MKHNPKVSVILTSYNHEKYLRASINSVLGQTFSDYELIIVDDASTDNSWDIINTYTDDRIRTFRNSKNQDYSDASPRVPAGEYIAIHHSDDVWEPDKLEKQVAILDAHPQIYAVFSHASIIGEEGEMFEDNTHFYFNIFNQPNRSRHEWLKFFFFNGNALCHSSVLIRKKCYDEFGYYRACLLQLPDFDMWIRLCLKYDIHIIPEKLVRFRVRANEANVSGSRAEAQIRHQFEFLQILDYYADINNPAEFIKIFPDAAEYFTKERFDMGFALAMCALKSRSNVTIFFGLRELWKIFTDEKRRIKVAELYGFSQKDFFELTGKYDIFATVKNPEFVDRPVQQALPVSSIPIQAKKKEQVIKTLSSQLQENKITKYCDTCIILHLYYPEMWEEISRYLLNLDGGFDLILTVPSGVDITDDTIKKSFSTAQVYRCENRGRDILPFLTLLPEILKLRYTYVCKIHTKQNTYASLGFDWRRDMLDKLLGSSEIVSSIKKAMDDHPEWGMIAPQGYVVPKNTYWRDNAQKVLHLACSWGLHEDEIDFSYVAGTMFWFRPKVFSTLANMKFTALDFEEEQGQTDGTLSHAYERFFGIVSTYSGFKIAESDGQRVILSEASPMLIVLAWDLENHKQVVEDVSTHLSHLDRTLSDCGKEIDVLNQALADRDRKIASLNQTLEERHVQLANLNQSLADRDKTIVSFNQTLADQDEQISHLKEDNFLRGEWALRLDGELKEAKNLLNQIISGNSWKVTRPFREARRWLASPRIQIKRYRLVLEKGKIQAMRRLMGLVVSHPATAIRLMRSHTIRKALAYLENNSWDIQKLVERAEGLYFRPGQEKQLKKIKVVCYPLISLYGLPTSSEDVFTPLPNDIEIKSWIEALTGLTGSLTQEGSAPKVSIIIPVHNQIRFTLACLHSIFIQKTKISYEVIIADDGSGDQTSHVFRNRFPQVRYFRNSKNMGFLRNCNAAAENASGEFLIFLNNDTLVCPGWLDELVGTFEENPGIGIVGSKLIYPDGTLQEAGGIIFDDGSGWNYGRFNDASLPEFNYMRDVDYCSGASLAVSAKLWNKLGGFDERFAPAYYEDTDLAFRVREAGYRVVYQPLSEVIHFEGISNGRSESSGIKKHQLMNKQMFYSKWRQVLSFQGKCTPKDLPADRSAKRRVLVIDATTPTPDKDSGSMDAFNYMMIMRELGFHVTFVPENVVHFGEYTKDLQRKGIECSHLPWINSPKEAVELYAPKADMVMLCRVRTAAPLVDLVRKYAPGAKIVFDTVDLHFLREQREAELLGSEKLMEKAAKTRETELDVIKKVDATILRSVHEMEFLRELVPDAGLYNFPIVRHIPGLSGIAWEQRRDVVFIGGFTHPPNADAVKYFVGEVWPILRVAGFSQRFVVVGSNVPDDIKALERDDIIVRGFVEDLSEIFNGCLLTVAPLRYGAGMKGKVVTSLSYGVPCVATKVAAEGSGLVHRENILVAESADEMASMIRNVCSDRQLWEKLSRSGLAYCENAFSIEATEKIMEKAFSEILGEQ